MLSPIENPRYLLIKRQRLLFFSKNDCSQSYACPSVLANRKENVEVFAGILKRMAGRFDFIYTRSEAGRKLLLKCRKKSYVNRNGILIRGKQAVVSKWE